MLVQCVLVTDFSAPLPSIPRADSLSVQFGLELGKSWIRARLSAKVRPLLPSFHTVVLLTTVSLLWLSLRHLEQRFRFVALPALASLCNNLCWRFGRSLGMRTKELGFRSEEIKPLDREVGRLS